LNERITRGKAIRLKCLDCCCGIPSEVRWCQVKRCPLWRFRMGREEPTEISADAQPVSAEQVAQTQERPKGDGAVI